MNEPKIRLAMSLVFTAICFTLFFTSPGYSQLSSGAVLGTVTDATGAVIPGVSIKVTNTATGLTRDAVTNESGNYRLDLLPLGDYQVEADLSGFRHEVRKGVGVGVDQRTRVDFKLG